MGVRKHVVWLLFNAARSPHELHEVSIRLWDASEPAYGVGVRWADAGGVAATSPAQESAGKLVAD